jgi:hypothetical protein
MDLVGAESRRGGTRGGRNQFTWESVKPEERGFYLGNSTAEAAVSSLPGQRRRGKGAPLDWYARPPTNESNGLGGQRGPTTTRQGEAVVARPSTPSADNRVRARCVGAAPGEGIAETGSIGMHVPAPDQCLGTANNRLVNTLRSGGRDVAFDDADSVRRREKAMLDAAIGGRSFSEAVRAALVESESASDVDDEPERLGGRSTGNDTGNPALSGDVKMIETPSGKERAEKARRKEERARRREERRARRAKRKDSSESERESLRSRRYEECDRRRRRRERESDRDEFHRRSVRRPRSEEEEGDSQDSDVAPRARRRQRHR